VDQEEEAPAVELPPSPESVSAARRFVRQQCQQWHLGANCDRLVLLVSETVTNAVNHARSRLVRVRLIHRAPVIRVEVHDDDPTLPAPVLTAQAAPDAESGRGMQLVEALSDEWGVTEHPEGGKTIWFDVAPSDERPAG